MTVTKHKSFVPFGEFGANNAASPAAPGAHTLSFFTEDIGGWWSFHGIHVESEIVLKLLEQYKHSKNCKSIVVLELPTGHVAYEWSDT